MHQPKLGLNLADILGNALFAHTFEYIFELTVTDWRIIATSYFYVVQNDYMFLYFLL